MYLKKSITVGQQELTIETGKMAKQADGAVVVRHGDTMLLVTAVSAREKKDVDFLPLTLEYQEKLYSAGRIPGSYFKREGRLTEKETLTSRLIDRACRPLFPEGYGYETQIIASVISSDQSNEGDIHGITGASAALWCSDIPFNGPIAGIRVGRVNGQLIANPEAKQREESDLDLIMACSREAIVMVEGGAKELSEAEMVDALQFGKQAVQPLLDLQDAMRRELGVKRRNFEASQLDESLKEKVRALAGKKIARGYEIVEKHARYDSLSTTKKEIIAQLKAEMGEAFTPTIEKAAKAVYEELHYNFPPFSVNETKPLRGPGRREIGHGALAERALRGMLPTNDGFPYTIRIVSDILESNGSSSMASVCGGTLALMDAGVPIRAPVAGIAMGLVKEGEKIAILSDILGDEDHLGDMDFKV